MKKVIHTHNYTKLAGGQHEEKGKQASKQRAGGEREIDEKRRVKVWALAGGQHEESGGQKQSAQSRDSLNRSQYKETALLDTTP